MRAMLLLVSLVLAGSAFAAPYKSVRIQILDRGQADGIVIRTPDDNWIVIDAETNGQRLH